MFREPPYYQYEEEDLVLLGVPVNDLQGDYDPRPASGPMVPFLGRRFTQEEIAYALCSASDIPEEPDAGKVKPVRAFEVKPLIGAILRAGSEGDLCDRLRHLLGDRLPGIVWEPPPVRLGALRKYLILRASVPAPPDETTGQPMGLELYGDIISVGGVRIASPEGAAWLGDRMDRRCGRSHSGEYPGLLPVEGTLEIRVRSATYANILNPGIGVPFYM